MFARRLSAVFCFSVLACSTACSSSSDSSGDRTADIDTDHGGSGGTGGTSSSVGGAAGESATGGDGGSPNAGSGGQGIGGTGGCSCGSETGGAAGAGSVAGHAGEAGSGGDAGGSPADACTPGTTSDCTTTSGGLGSSTCDATGAPGICQPVHCTEDTAAENCVGSDGTPGARACLYDDDDANTYSWSACVPFMGCMPGDSEACGLPGFFNSCQYGDQGWQYDPQGCDTPLVVSFDAAHVKLTAAAGAFDLAGEQASFGSAWVSAETPWLALDRDGNGRIDDGAELFGSMTKLPSGGRARNGFEALAVLDDDGNRRIDRHDAAWASILLWSDANQDRVSSSAELRHLDEAGLIEIDLGYAMTEYCTAGGCERERSTFVFRDEHGTNRSGAVLDVHLARTSSISP